MGKIIDKIKLFVNTNKTKSRKRLILKSTAQQVVDYLEQNRDIDNFQLYYLIRNNFDFLSLFELAQRLKIRNNVSHHYSFFKEYDFSILIDKTLLFLNTLEYDRNSSESLALMIRMKKDLLLIADTINIKSIQNKIDSIIIDKTRILESNLQENISLKDSLGFFFIYPKDEAIIFFQNVLVHYLRKTQDYKNVNYKIDIYVKKLFLILDLDFIPQIKWDSHYDFNRNSIYEYDKIFNITYDEILGIKKINKKFLTLFPLGDITTKQLINPKKDFLNIENLNFIKGFFSYFFEKKICKEKFKVGTSNVFDLFWISCTGEISKYKSKDLNKANLILTKLIKNDNQNFDYILALFLYVKNNNHMKSVTAKIPKLIKAYFKDESYSENTIKDLLIRGENKNLKFNVAYKIVIEEAILYKKIKTEKN